MLAYRVPELISVVVPVHTLESKLPRIRNEMARCPGIELVIVLNGEAMDTPLSPNSNERVVVSQRAGRGYAMVEGARASRGSFVLFLHSDTLLPDGWDREVREILRDDEVVGGAFSLSFDTPLLRMRAMAMLSDMWLMLTGHLWGDRAIFVRAEVLKECLERMQVPIFEDVRLSQQMRRKGRIGMSRKSVVTSWGAFRRHGALGHLWTIVKCHYWYIIGWDPERIFEEYYR